MNCIDDVRGKPLKDKIYFVSNMAWEAYQRSRGLYLKLKDQKLDAKDIKKIVQDIHDVSDTLFYGIYNNMEDEE